METANKAADCVRVWRRLVRIDNASSDKRFAFTQARTVTDFFVGLITKDLNGGALDTWLKETGNEFDRAKGMKAAVRHQITLDIYVDEFEMIFVVSRNRVRSNDRTEADTISVRFVQPAPDAENEFVYGLRSKDYKAGSKLIRRLDGENIRGWGTCLTEDIAGNLD
ncbi:hypothetical protein BSZ16_19570 [Bradyrhizobium canariense]|nr:hypothetical protein BSZ24_28570 [Bradyrhizobium canariense]OSJ01347.1 hypothetical protein BSZ16_19570 [Bradyrhizobium canariense]